MSDYTPTTETVRNVYARAGGFQEPEVYAAAFGRWLAQHDAEVRTATLTATADALPPSTTPLGGELGISEAVHARVQEWLRAQAGGAA